MPGPYAVCWYRDTHQGSPKVAIVLCFIPSYTAGNLPRWSKRCHGAMHGPFAVCCYRDTHQGGLKVAIVLCFIQSYTAGSLTRWSKTMPWCNAWTLCGMLL